MIQKERDDVYIMTGQDRYKILDENGFYYEKKWISLIGVMGHWHQIGFNTWQFTILSRNI